MEYRNENEIRFFGIRHSGNHALGFWIRALFEGKTLYLNNRRFGADPFGSRQDKDRLSFKECVLISYEDKDISLLQNTEVPPNRYKVLGPSKNRVDMLILRDLYNTVASNIAISGVRGRSPLSEYPDTYDTNKYSSKDASIISAKNYSQINYILKLWVLYAEEYLGNTEFLDNNKIFISFNKWFSDRSYRDKLASMLGKKNKDNTINTMARVLKKSPSSFDTLEEYDGRAQEMKVLERWKYFKDNPIYWNIFERHPEAVKLNKQIFGDILKGNNYGN